MEDRRKASDQSKMKTSKFRIPKKKGDAWLEEVQQSSPLSRLSTFYSHNSFKNRDHFSSPYDRIRNQECCTYSIRRKHDIHKCSVTEEKANVWSVCCQKMSAASPKKQIECPQDKGKKYAFSPLRRCNEEPKGNEETDSHKKGNKSLTCRVPDLEEDQCLNCWSRKRRSSGSSSDQSSTTCQEKSAQRLKELKSNCLSHINKSQRRNRQCLKKEGQCSEPQENRTQLQEEDMQLITCHRDNMEVSQKPSLDSLSKAPTCKSSSTRDNSLRTSPHLKIGGKCQNLRKLHTGSHYSKRSAGSADPMAGTSSAAAAQSLPPAASATCSHPPADEGRPHDDDQYEYDDLSQLPLSADLYTGELALTISDIQHEDPEELTQIKDMSQVRPQATAERPEATAVRHESAAVRHESAAVRHEATAVRHEATAVRLEAAAVRHEALRPRQERQEQQLLGELNVLSTSLLDCQQQFKDTLEGVRMDIRQHGEITKTSVQQLTDTIQDVGSSLNLSMRDMVYELHAMNTNMSERRLASSALPSPSSSILGSPMRHRPYPCPRRSPRRGPRVRGGKGTSRQL